MDCFAWKFVFLGQARRIWVGQWSPMFECYFKPWDETVEVSLLPPHVCVICVEVLRKVTGFDDLIENLR